jgi:pilus assembly protein TadC
MVTVPFSFLPPKLLNKTSDKFMGVGKKLARFFPTLQIELDRVNYKIDAQRYLSMCVSASLALLVFSSIFLTLLFKLPGILAAFFFTTFIFFMQVKYPKVRSFRRIRKLDADLLAALRALMIQLNAGVPLFEALVAVSQQNLGEVSKEFKKVVKKINAGVPQIEALEELAVKNPSPYFRRAIWQLINGMKQGATINPVITSVVEHLTKEQIIQIEKYGSQLSPLAMFYMMGAVILPALGITFIIILTGFINLGEDTVKLVLWGLIAGITFFQIMFSGAIRSKRPSLLGE